MATINRRPEYRKMHLLEINLTAKASSERPTPAAQLEPPKKRGE